MSSNQLLCHHNFVLSNYCFDGTRKPDFEDFAFQFSEEEKIVNIKVLYY